MLRRPVESASTAALGDVNGDGIDDYAIAAPGAGNIARPGSGAVYVVFGGSDTQLDLQSMTAAQGYRIDGAAISQAAGTSTRRFVNRAIPHNPVGYSAPPFQVAERYQGVGVAGSCTAPRTQFTPTCGTQYQNYIFPRASFAAGSFPSVVVAAGATTGVRGGGIARGVFRVDAGFQVRPWDEIAYTDHNVPCSAFAVARWRFVSRGKLNAWLPYREPDLYQRTHGVDSNCA